MALSYPMTTLVSSVLAIGVFSGMQLYRQYLSSSGPMTVLGGGLGAMLFIFSLTAMGNLELFLFGRTHQTGLFPEVVICLIVAALASGRVHGVCLTTCFIFSSISLYYMNRISQKEFLVPQPPVHSHKKK